MSWATSYIAKLKNGETVKFRPRGSSMTPRIESGQLCTVEPIGDRELAKDDIVLCKVRKAQYLHLVYATKAGQALIGNNRGHINGWASKSAIFGVLTNIEP